VFPYLHYDNYERLDCSKLDQWEILFEHAGHLGMFLHFKTSEVENQGLLDGGDLGPQRKLYYRELMARFGHHLALNWNIGEENGLWRSKITTPWQTTTQRLAMAQYFHDHDPYQHHVVIHNGQQFYDLLGPESKYTGISLQTHRPNFELVHPHVLKWRKLSLDNGHTWAIAVDEPGDARHSLLPDAEDPDHDLARQNALWGALMAGAWGIEWYFGYNHAHSDLSCQDWRSRDLMWDQSRHAIRFFKDQQLPFWKMEPMDELTTNDDFVFALKDDTYVLYQKLGKKEKTTIPEITGSFTLRWYNPRTGSFHGDPSTQTASGKLTLPIPPTDTEKDWVVLLKRK
ncbi:MAG: putative collagen-binding domain-containing protein, partial [Bacteroidota bacterium]